MRTIFALVFVLVAGRVEAIGLHPHIPLAQTTGVHHVTTTGVASGPGTAAAPWTIAYAFAGGGGEITAGDTIWIRGGTYNLGSTAYAISNLVGTLTAPIIFRAYPGERATLEWNVLASSRKHLTLSANSAYLVLWNLELRNVDASVRIADTLVDHDRGTGVEILAPGSRVINCIIHDVGISVGTWSAAPDTDVSGNIFYYNGMHATASPGVRDTGYGVYMQTDDSATGKRFVDNITFKNYAYGMHAYGSNSAYHRNIRFEGNAYFATNQIAPTSSTEGWSFLLGGEEELNCQDNFLVSNYFHGIYGGDWGSINLGYSGPCTRTRVFSNYAMDRRAGGVCVALDSDDHDIALVVARGNVVSGNTFCGPENAEFQTAYPSNTYVDTSAAYPTTGNQIFLRPNVYEPGRAHIIVFNWTLASSVEVDLAPANFSSGDTYAIYDAQDYFGTAVATGTYSGSAITLPMTATSVATPYGTVGTAPTNTLPQFGAFVLKKTSP